MRVALIGAGTLGRAVLAQARRMPGLHVIAIADTSREAALDAARDAGWPEEGLATSPAKAIASQGLWPTDDAVGAITAGGVEVIIEASGDAVAGVRHALAAFHRGRPVVMANPAAEALAGPLLARRALQADVIHAPAAGLASASLAAQVERARACGLEVVSAGCFNACPADPRVTPDTLPEGLEGPPARLTARLDGSQAATELAAAANAIGLLPRPEGLSFAACPPEDLTKQMLPATRGGLLEGPGRVDAVSGPGGITCPWEGTFVVAEGWVPLGGGTAELTALTRPLPHPATEVLASAASVVLRGEAGGEAGGAANHFAADVVCVAKKGLDRDQVLDGMGGACVYGKLMPAADALKADLLPIGLAKGARLKTHIAVGHPIRWFDVEIDMEAAADVMSFRREMEWLLAGHKSPFADA